MRRRILNNIAFYTAAVVLASYLSDGESTAQRITYLSTALVATFMSQRGTSPAGAPVSRITEPQVPVTTDMIAVSAHVEDLLSRAS